MVLFELLGFLGIPERTEGVGIGREPVFLLLLEFVVVHPDLVHFVVDFEVLVFFVDELLVGLFLEENILLVNLYWLADSLLIH